ncbi:MAG TPA: efflux transporter outer membrane subunit [Gammaproteobacteria bacterium]|nr:efflux transporter outer membrane subunit [Gammaproteobacteria bacterium]
MTDGHACPSPTGDRHRGRAVALGVLVALIGGCAVGPSFVRPAPPNVTTYTAEGTAPNLVPGASEPSQRLLTGQAIPAAWWRLFRSPALDTVVRQALSASPTISAAKARLAQAQQLVAQARGAYYPQIDAGASAERLKGPPIALGIRPNHNLPTFNLYSVGTIASFDPDVFGLTARQVEKRAAQAETRVYQLAAAQLAVSGNAVTAAITAASLRSQIHAAEALVAADRNTLALVREKFAVGKVARTHPLAAEFQLSNDRALLPPLRQRLAAAEDALATLVGELPAQWTPPALTLADFTLPTKLPVSLPSALVRHRPDILAAQARLHASSAAVGVADARMYPDFRLSASFGTAALAATSLGEGANLVWTLASGLTAPIFHGGSLRAQKRAAVAQFHATLAIYRQTVLVSFQQVADVLRALGHDAELVNAARHALDASRSTLSLQRLRYRAGKTSRLRLLAAERRYQEARLRYIQAKGNRYLDSAQLFVALGGGGWVNPTRCTECSVPSGATGNGNRSYSATPGPEYRHESMNR